MKKNYTIFLGLAAIGGAAYYFVNSTKSKTSKDSDKPYVPPASSSTKASPLRVANTVSQALKDNENAFVYNGKIVWLNSLLNVSKFLPSIDKRTRDQLLVFYKFWKSRSADLPLPYGDVNKGNIDKYIADLLLAGKTFRDNNLL
jgi:hypothetical protein